MSGRKALKTGVHRLAGPPPGYAWNVVILDLAFDDAMAFLNESQYRHLAEQVQQLAHETDPTHSVVCDVDAIEDYHELREKNGPLGNINVRLFFFLDKSTRSIVVLGVIKKENNGPTPLGDKIRMRRRKRLYLAGQFGEPEV